MWRTAKIVETARFAFFNNFDKHGREFAAWKNLFSETKLPIHMGSKYTIYPDFYSIDHVGSPVIVTYRLGPIGTSSYVLYDETKSVKTGKILHAITHRQVHLDANLRKPAPLPQWYIDKFADRVGTDKGWRFGDPPTIPEKAFVHVQKPVWGDVDIFKHVNHASYIKFSMDAIAQGSHEGRIGHLQGHQGDMKVKSMEMLYAAETMAEEELAVNVWLDDHGNQTLHCQINKQDQPVYFCNLQIY